MGKFNFNTITLDGRIGCKKGTSPEIRHTNSGTQVCEVSLAVDQWNAVKKEKESYFISLVFWGDLATDAGKLASGDPVCVQGELRDASYQKNGQTINKLVIWVDKLRRLERSSGRQDAGHYGGEPAQRSSGYGASRAGSGYGNGGAQGGSALDDADDLGPPVDVNDL